MPRLHQSRGNDFRTYETAGDGLVAEYQLEGSYRSYRIPYESIDFDEIVTGSGPTRSQLLTLASVVANLLLALAIGLLLAEFAAWAVWEAVVFAGLCVLPLLYWARKVLRQRKTKILEGSEDLEFYYDADERDAVDDFVGELKKAKTGYLHRKYLKIDRLLPLEEQKASVDWLYQNQQIERRIYQVYLEEYEHLKLLRGN